MDYETLQGSVFYMYSDGKMLETFEQGTFRFNFDFEITTGVGYRLKCVYESRGGGRSKRSMVEICAII